MNGVDNIHFIEDEDFFCLLNQDAENHDKLIEFQTQTSIDSSVSKNIIEDRSDR
jgi:hypothetical protein